MNKRRKDNFLFKFYRLVLGTVKYHKYKFVGLENIDEPCILIANHLNSISPAQFSFYFPYQFKIWANGEFFGGISSVYKALHHYLRVKQKKSKFVAWLIAVIGTPWFWVDIKISQVIPTYDDARFYITISQSVDELNSGGVVILFPEESETGYQDDMVTLKPGFIYLLDYLRMTNRNIPVIPAFVNKSSKTINIGQKINYEELLNKNMEKEEILKYFADQMNNLYIK